jgi:nucleotide-binding universal stress UspA family protein
MIFSVADACIVAAAVEGRLDLRQSSRARDVAELPSTAARRRAMAYKTILVHCDATRGVAAQLAVAADLAQRFEARLVGLHAREPFQFDAINDGGTQMMSVAPLVDAYNQACETAEKTVRTAFDRATKGRSIVSELRIAEAFPDEALTVGARYADLLVVGQSDAEDPAGGQGDLPEVTALATARPVLVVPKVGVQLPVGKTVMLCWNASRESARAATDALPFLKAADKVVILIVDPHRSNNGHGQEPGADVALWLARHGVKVSVQREVAADIEVGEIILSRAADLGADLIVMGVYGHSRVREMMLGGVSRTMLSSMTVPVLMAH